MMINFVDLAGYFVVVGDYLKKGISLFGYDANFWVIVLAVLGAVYVLFRVVKLFI